MPSPRVSTQLMAHWKRLVNRVVTGMVLGAINSSNTFILFVLTALIEDNCINKYEYRRNHRGRINLCILWNGPGML